METPVVEKRFLSRTHIAYILLTITTLLWAGNIVLARGIAHQAPPVALSFWRWFLAFIIITPFTWRYVWANRKTIKENLPILMLFGFLGVTTFNTLLYTALKTTTAINAALIQAAMPSMVLSLAWVLWREKINRNQLIGTVLCITGAVWIISKGSLELLRSLNFVRGDLLIVLAVGLYAFYSALLRKRPKMHPLAFLTSSFGLGVMMLTPLYFFEMSRVGMMPINSTVITSLLYMAIGPSILAYLCWNHGLYVLGPSRGGLFINLIPLFTAILSILFLGESLQFFHLVGGTLLLVGIIVFNRRL